jgi:hypothetical protein
MVGLWLQDLHAARERVVLDAVVAMLRCGSVVSASVGRTIATQTTEKHGIKRVDRLLGNMKLWSELVDVYRRLAAQVVGTATHPVVLVDWTQVGRDKCVLKAVLALRGRGVPLYAEAHPLSAQARPGIHRRFLARLRQILPSGCVPVLVTDAGFKQPWAKAVEAMGWDFVTRVRGRTCVRESADSPWFRAKACASQVAAGELRDMPQAEVNVHDTVQCRVLLWDGRSQRARKRPTESGRRIRARRAIRASHEPWLLATSLRSDAADIVAVYALRMQVEQSIRDDKTHAWGWRLAEVGTRTCKRLDIQLVLIALATTVAMLVGIAAEQEQLARRYQANTERRRRVLSFFALGRRAIASADISGASINAALDWLRSHIPQISWLYARL